MNIAITIKNTHFHEGYGGMETQNKTLAEGLVARGHKVIVFTPKKGYSNDTVTENGVKYVFVDCVFKKFNFLFEAAPNSWQHRLVDIVATYHSNDKFDVFLCQSSSGLGLIKNKKLFNVPIISISHGSKLGEVKSVLKSLKSIKSYIKFLLDVPHILRAFFITQRAFIHGSDKVIAVSNAVVTQLCDETYASKDKFNVIFNGISYTSDKTQKKVTSKDFPPKILFLSRILKEKGVFLLVDVLLKLQDMPWVLEIVGDGPELKNLKGYVEKIGLNSRIFIEGAVSHELAMEKMWDADIFVLPSMRVEGFPMVLVEAMFANLPIIVTDIGGNSDAIEDGKTGYLVKPGDADDLSNRLSLLLENPSLREKMSTSARIRAEQNFTLDIMLEKYEAVIKEVIGK